MDETEAEFFDAALEVPNHHDEIEIGGATYGPADVTDKVREMVEGGTIQIKASNSNFGDPWHGNKKSLSITSRLMIRVT